MNTNLAPVFLDDQPVALEAARPQVSDILAASGKPEATQVKWLKSSSDTHGKSLRAEEVVDRTSEPGKAIYLSSGAKGEYAAKPFAGKGGWTGGQPAAAGTNEGNEAGMAGPETKSTSPDMPAGREAATDATGGDRKGLAGPDDGSRGKDREDREASTPM